MFPKCSGPVPTMIPQWNHHVVHLLAMQSLCMSNRAMYSPCAHLCIGQKHFGNIWGNIWTAGEWIHCRNMLRLHLECEQIVSGKNRLSKLHLIPQCSHHVITCFQRPLPPVTSSRVTLELFQKAIGSLTVVQARPDQIVQQEVCQGHSHPKLSVAQGAGSRSSADNIQPTACRPMATGNTPVWFPGH